MGSGRARGGSCLPIRHLCFLCPGYLLLSAPGGPKVISVRRPPPSPDNTMTQSRILLPHPPLTHTPPFSRSPCPILPSPLYLYPLALLAHLSTRPHSSSSITLGFSFLSQRISSPPCTSLPFSPCSPFFPFICNLSSPSFLLGSTPHRPSYLSFPAFPNSFPPLHLYPLPTLLSTPLLVRHCSRGGHLAPPFSSSPHCSLKGLSYTPVR